MHYYSSISNDEFHSEIEGNFEHMLKKPKVFSFLSRPKLFQAVLLGLLLLVVMYSNEITKKQNRAAVLNPKNIMSSMYVLDACASSPSKSKTECCTDRNYPVLGGIDVVALGDVHKGNPPVLGTLDFPAALPTKVGAYVFLFSSKVNQQLFIQDPWKYAPKWGGFDALEIAQNNALKGEAGKQLLGMNTDTNHFLMQSGHRTLMFSGSKSKSTFLYDLDHWEGRGDDKWLGWWGTLNDGPFNTQCLTGLSYSELLEANERYKSGELKLGPVSVKERYLENTPRKQLKNAVSSSRVFYVSPDSGLSTFLVEDGSGLGFGLTTSILDLGPVSSAMLAIDQDSHPGSVFVADLSNQQLLRICSNSLNQDVVLADLKGKIPVGIAWSPSDERLYYASSSGVYWVDKSGSSGGILIELPEAEITDIAAGASYLYYLNKAKNQLQYTSVLEVGDSAPVSWNAIPSPEESISFITTGAEDGQLFIVTETQTVYEWNVSEGISDQPIKRFSWPEPISGLQVAGSILYLSSANRILSTQLPLPESSDDPPQFKEVLSDLELTHRGLLVKTWASPNGLAFSTHTKYTDRGDKPVFNDYPWAAGLIVEPFMLTTLRVSSPIDAETVWYSWGFQGETASGTEFQVTLQKTGTYPIILRELDVNGATLRELRSSLVCKYVRREIKTLTDEDREAFFDGLEVMVTIPQIEGTSKYGPHFKNAEYFTHMHNVLGGSRDCDHLHHGRGFLTNHMSLNMQFEQSLQMVNPALVVPYWDYTVESAEIKKYHDGDLTKLWSSSPIFRPDWFGDAHNEEFTVTEGRWAYKLKIPDDQWDNQRHNSYGMMRAPWNNNPSPYVQRFDEFCGLPIFRFNQGWPTCYDHFDLSVNYLTFMDYIPQIQAWPHGTVHGVLGGTINFDKTLKRLEGVFATKDLDILKLRSPHITKGLWRKGLVECPEYCSMDTPMEECKCVCSQEELAKLDTDKDLFNLYAGATVGQPMVGTYDRDALKLGIEVICNAGFVIGDQEESASPADPIFWPIHPTMERLFQWKLLNGGFEDMTWPEEDGNYGAAINFGSNQRCIGHNPGDRLPWSITVEGKDTPTNYLNREMMTLLDISGDYRLQYVYDNFEWSHCSEQGYDFGLVGSRNLEITSPYAVKKEGW